MTDTPLEVKLISQSLHDQIMRLPCTPPKDANVNQSISYKSGHRDARHAAAELAAEHEAEQQQELTAIEAMARMLEGGEWAEHVGQLGGPIAQRLETEITRLHNEQQAAQAAVPEGWKLVPVEPTQEMATAYRYGTLLQNRNAWRAMLSAAPTPPEGPWESPCTPPAQQSQWVPVSARLPQLDIPVWLFDEERGLFMGMRISSTDGWLWAECTFYRFFGSQWESIEAHFDDFEPSHWMPLPSAPGDTAAPEQAEQPHPVNRSVIRDVFLRNGFTIKEGHSDLKPYVYAAAEELLALDGKEVAAEQDAVKVPRELLGRITRNGGVDTLLAIDELRALLGGGA